MATQNKSPIQRMKDEHKDKETLVDRLLDVLDAGSENKEDVKARLLAASNKKLLRLLESTREMKSRFGSREALAAAVAGAMNKAKDKDFVARIAKFTTPRLMGLYNSVAGKAKSASPAK